MVLYLLRLSVVEMVVLSLVIVMILCQTLNTVALLLRMRVPTVVHEESLECSQCRV